MTGGLQVRVELTDGHAMTAGVQAKPTEALTRRTARKFAISSFLILAVVLLAFIVVLNVWSYMYSYGHIDARSNYQVQTFIDEHQSAEDHTYGLSKSFILTVRDTGMGMDPETVAHVFDRFYRSEQARQVNPQGTGLGLPIAEWIANRHGGRIDIASERGRGTTARVLLPRVGA